MVPSSDVLEAAWKIVTGLLIGAILGGLGVGLLVREVWQWFTGRTRGLRTSAGTPSTVLKGQLVEPPARDPALSNQRTDNPGKKTDTAQKAPAPKLLARPSAAHPAA